MKIVIDNVEYTGLTEQPRDVLAAVAAVSDYVRTRGRAVMSVRVDGTHVPPDRLVETLQAKATGSVEMVEVTTEGCRVLGSSSRELIEL